MKDGGPAFPSEVKIYKNIDPSAIQSAEPRIPIQTKRYPGMSLRDWYKGKALLGLLAGGYVKNMPPIEAAKWAGKYADAMLKEREKGGAA